jgi:DNA integrity scanning protein DisA with diadenylate cyclase activity
MSRKISFSIAKNGDVTLKDVCGLGTNCQEATQDIEKLLGNVDENSRSLTQNYFVENDPLKLTQDAG